MSVHPVSVDVPARRPVGAPVAPARWTQRRQIVVFLLLAAGLSWWIWPMTLLNPTSTALVPWGPTIAALVVTGLAYGRHELGRLALRMVRWRVHPGWYAVGLLGPLVLLGVPALVLLALGARPEVTEPFPGPAILLLVFAVRFVLGGALGEDPGWRGFLLPRVRARHGLLAASLLVGVVWMAWHLPLFLSGPATDQRPPLQFALWGLALSVVFAWIYERTDGSLLIVMLFHAMVDTFASLVFPLFMGGNDYGRLWWLLIAVAWLAAAAVVAVERRSAGVRPVVNTDRTPITTAATQGQGAR
jgi:uncharacterized protein